MWLQYGSVAVHCLLISCGPRSLSEGQLGRTCFHDTQYWIHDFGCPSWQSVSGSCVGALLQVADQTCIHQVFYFLLIGLYGIITKIRLELLQMFQSTDKEREAKMMPSPHGFFSACWKPRLLQRGMLIAGSKPAAEAGELNLRIVLHEWTNAQVNVQVMERVRFADLEHTE